MYSTTNNINSAHAFLIDEIMITKGSIQEKESEHSKVLNRLDKKLSQ